MIAFSVVRDLPGDWEIYALQDDGADLRRLSDPSLVQCTNPRWSPDGKQLLFTARSQGRNGESCLHLVDPDGCNLRAFPTVPAEHILEWRPDGTVVLAFPRNGSLLLGLLEADLASLSLLGDISDGTYSLPSPDRLRSIRVHQRSMRSVRVDVVDDNGSIKRLDRPDLPMHVPAWSPSGELIAFTSPGSQSRELWVMDLSGSAVRLGGMPSDGSFRWSPDSRRLAYVGRGADSLYALCVAEADGSGQHFLLDINDGDASHALRSSTPVWSPDGSSIAFSTFAEDCRFHVERIRPDGTDLRRLTSDNPSFDLIYDLDWGRTPS